MTPAARLSAAIEILDALDTTSFPADRYVRDFFSARRYAGSKDRAAVAERVYAVLRRRASLSWRMGSSAPRALVIASLLEEGMGEEGIAALFGSSSYAPPALTDEERAILARTPEPPPPHVAHEYPEFLEPELRRAFGENLSAEMDAMAGRAPVDLRVNRLRATRDAMLEGLRALEVACEATPFSPDGIRVASTEGLSKLRTTQFFQTGAIEFQDESSQIAALLCGAKPGMRVLDIAAGGGGKTLALAAIMNNEGEIRAWDENPSRLKQLSPRALRAGATNIAVKAPEEGEVFDIVLVDAPCSGSGTWRRNPESKWRLTQEKLDGLHAAQDGLLDQALRFVAPGGRILYATCSLLPSENEDRVEAFSQRAPIKIADASSFWPEGAGAAPPFDGAYFRASPRRTGSDGFFASVLEPSSS